MATPNQQTTTRGREREDMDANTTTAWTVAIIIIAALILGALYFLPRLSNAPVTPGANSQGVTPGAGNPPTQGTTPSAGSPSTPGATNQGGVQ